MSISHESSINSLEEQVKSINKSYKESTDLIGKSVDKIVGVFGGETVEKIYKDQIKKVQEQSTILLAELHNETLTEEQKIRLQRLKAGKLEDVGIIGMTKNTDFKQAVVNSAYGVKGEVTGTINGIKIMITGVFDLAIFMFKYTGSMLGINPEYKEKINDQATQIYEWIIKEGRVGVQDKIFEFIEIEMVRISKLPQEEQAEAIGNIAGNIIGMLTGIKAGLTLVKKSGQMAGKVDQAARITEKLVKKASVNTARMSQVEKLGKQAGFIRIGSSVAEKALNGVAESLIGYGFAKGFSLTWELIKNPSVSASKKLSAIEKTLSEMEDALKTETNQEKKQTLNQEIQKLREKKVKIQRPEENIDHIKSNANLSPESRIQKAEDLLGGKVFSEEQKKVIINIHENISKGVFSNDYATLNQMTKKLLQVGLNNKDIRILMENGILGFGLKNTSYAIGKLNRIELPEERLLRGGIYDYSGETSRRKAYLEALDEKDKEMMALNQNTDFVSGVRNKPNSKIEIKKRLERERKGGKRDPEYIMEQAKQVGAKLFVLGEDIMKQNPNLTGAELKELILKKASESGMKVSPYQRRVLDRQGEIFDALKIKRDVKIKGWFDKAGIAMPNDIKQIEELLNSNEALKFEVGRDVFSTFFTNKDQKNKFLLGIAMKTQDPKIGAIPFNTNTKRILTIIDDVSLGKNIESADIDWFRSIRDDHKSWTGIIKDIFKLKLININISDFPLKIATSIDENIFGFFNGKAEYAGSVLGVEKGGTHIYKSSRAVSDTFDHEYQHFLNENFLYPKVLYQDSSINRNGVTTDIANRKIGRELFARQQDSNSKGKIWQSMQNELCSYIERNSRLPKNIDHYLHSGLNSKLNNGEIPQKNILEIEGAISELELYFNNPKVPREEFVGIIRTSYSIDDMLNRLYKKYGNLFLDNTNKIGMDLRKLKMDLRK